MWKKATENIRNTGNYFTDELRIIVHDPGALLIFILALIIYPLFYSVAYNNETVRDNPIAVVDLDHTVLSRTYARLADATEQLRVSCKTGSLSEAEDLFYRGDIRGVILIPEGFERDLLKGEQAKVKAYCDAGYMLLYKQVYAGATYAARFMGAGIEIKRELAAGKSMDEATALAEPLNVHLYSLYNPAAGYGSFIMPGIILIILQQTLLIGIGLLGGTTRERDRYNHHAGPGILPGGSVPAVLGKSMAYLLIYMFNAVFGLLWVQYWFVFPDASGFLSTLVLLIPYFLAIAFMGLAVSVLFRERVHSLLFMVFLSPIVLFLSGLSWPSLSIPPLLYGLAHVFPSTLVVPAYIRLRIMGASVSSISAELGWLLVQMVIYFVLAIAAYRYARKRFLKNSATLVKLVTDVAEDPS